jgi:DnaJ-class molecular chaperone
MIDTILYDRLGLSPSNSEEEIKKEGKKLLLKYHPDKNENKEEATKKFIEIKEAIDILTDKKKRELYHANGISVVNNINNIQDTPDTGMAGFPGFQGMPFDPSFLFNFMSQFNKINSFRGFPGMPGMQGMPGMSGMSGMPGMPEIPEMADMSKIKDINCCIKIDVPTIQEEAVFNIEYPRNLFCSNCKGKGGEKKTDFLNGLQINRFNMCQNCFGKGFIVEHKKVTITLDKKSVLKLIEKNESIVIVDQGHISDIKKTNLVVKFISM